MTDALRRISPTATLGSGRTGVARAPRDDTLDAVASPARRVALASLSAGGPAGDDLIVETVL